MLAAIAPAQSVPEISSFTATPSSIVYGQPSTLAWNVSNATSLALDNGIGTVTGTTSITVRPTMTTVYQLTATNSDGSVSSQTTVTVTADSTAPTVPTGLTAIVVTTSRVDLNWTASTDNVGVEGYQIYRNGSPAATSTSTSFSDTGLVAGTYTYTVAAYDAAGNRSAQSSPASANTMSADTQAPTVSIGSPANNQVLSGSVTVTANAADDVSVAGVNFYLDGTQLGQEVTTSPYSIAWDTLQSTNASHVLTAVARDTAGNTATSAALTVTVSNSSLRPYTTNFPLNENPISENNNWINGRTTGLDWSDVQVSQGMAFGTQIGSYQRDDSIAVLAGVWGPDQTVQATVHTVNQNPTVFETVQLRLRTTIAAHNVTGYLLNFRAISDGSQFVQILRWGGPLGSITLIDARSGPGLHDGDVIKGTVVGNVITAYINGLELFHVTDNTFTSGSPGMGFYLQSFTQDASTMMNADYGLTNFTASDGSINDTTPPSIPTNLSAAGVSSSQINLSWTASADNVSAPVQISYGCYRNGVRFATTAAGTTSCSDTGLAAGTTYTYTVNAQDASGNTSSPSAGMQGTTQPLPVVINSFIASPASLTAGLSSTLSWNVSNAMSLTVDNGVGTVTGTTSVNVSPAVTTVYHLTATNSAGSTNAQTTVTVTADTTAPTTPTGLIANVVTTTRIDLNWVASTDNVGVAGYQIYRNGLPVTATAATSFSDTGLVAGSYNYAVAAYDAAGNSSALSSQASANTMSADTQAPTVSISSPANNQVLSGSVTVTVNAADDVSVAGVKFYRDGALIGQEMTASPYSIAWNTLQSTNASHVLTAVARDTAGNTATSTAVTVTVNNPSPRPYTTNFPLNENPISENNNWINGKAAGLDWADIRVRQGLVFGTQIETGGYEDSTAVLAGTWGSDQVVQATVHTANQNNQIFEEVELRLRTTITAHRITGYEVNFRCTSDGTQYVQMVRWNGALGDFTLIDSRAGPGIHNGDVVKATIVGSTITAYINDVQIFHATDSIFVSGSPGMGFYLADYLPEVAAVRNGDFGFTTFMASDGSTTDTFPPSTPTSLSATGASSSQINLSWASSTDNVAVAGYQIFRNNVRVANSNATSYSDAGLSANTQYTYSVTAFDAAGNVSPQSSTTTGTTLSLDTAPPSIPSGLQSSNITSSSVTISWSPSTDNLGVAGYEVFRSGTRVGTTPTASFADTGLFPSTTYNYAVTAYDYSNNKSDQSQQLGVTTAASSQGPPLFVQATEKQIASGSNVSVGFYNSTSPGNTIVVYVVWSNTGSVTLTDNGDDTFVSASEPVLWGGGNSAQVFHATGITGGATVVTASFRNDVGSFGTIYVHEYSGISTANPVDATTAATGSSASMSSGNITTTSPNDLIFGAGVSGNSVTAAGSDFVSRSLAFGGITEDRTATSTGSYSATATQNGTIWAMQVVAFRPGT